MWLGYNHLFGNSDQAKAPRRTVAKVTARAMSQTHGMRPPASSRRAYEVKQRSHELSGWEPGLWLRHASYLCLTAPVESSLCINLVQESKKKYVLINSLGEPSQQVSQERRKRDCANNCQRPALSQRLSNCLKPVCTSCASELCSAIKTELIMQ